MGRNILTRGLYRLISCFLSLLLILQGVLLSPAALAQQATHIAHTASPINLDLGSTKQQVTAGNLTRSGSGNPILCTNCAASSTGGNVSLSTVSLKTNSNIVQVEAQGGSANVDSVVLGNIDTIGTGTSCCAGGNVSVTTTSGAINITGDINTSGGGGNGGCPGSVGGAGGNAGNIALNSNTTITVGGPLMAGTGSHGNYAPIVP